MKDLGARIVITAKDRASGAVGRLRQQFTGLHGVVLKLGAALGTYFSLRGILGFFTGATRVAASLEEQLSTVGAITRATAEEMARLKATAEEMGATTRYTATESAQAMEALGRAGLNATETISALPDVLALAQGNSLELGRAAEIVTQASAGMGLEIEESGRIVDVFTATAANANTNVEDLAQAFSYAAPSARALGLSVEDLSAYIGKLADAGIGGTRAGTALNSMLSQLSDESSKFSKTLREAGIHTTDFNQMLRELEAAGEGGKEAINAIGREAGPALKSLLAQGTASVAALSEELRNAEGEANRVAEAMDDNLAGAFKSLGSAWDALKTYIGDPLLDKLNVAARDLAGTLREMVSSGALEKLRQQIVDTFEGGYESLKRFIGGLADGETQADKLRGTFARVSSWLSTLGNAAKAAGYTIIAAFKTVDSAVSAVATGIAGAITVVQAGLNKLVQGLNYVGLASDEAAGKSQALQETLVETTKQLGRRTVQSAKDAAEAVQIAGDSLEAMGNQAESAGEQVSEASDKFEHIPEHMRDMAEAAEELGLAWDHVAQNFVAGERTFDKAIRQQQEMEQAVDETAERFASLSDNTAEAFDRIDSLHALLKDTGRTATEVGDALEQAFGAAIADAKTLADLAEIERRIHNITMAGDLSVDAMDRLAKSIASQRDEMEKTEGGIQSLKEAYEELGITSDAAIAEQIAKWREAYEYIDKNSDSIREQEQAWLIWAEAAVEAGDKAAISQAKTEAAMRGTAEQLDELIAKHDKSAQAAEKSAEAQGRAGKAASDSAKAQKQAASEADGLAESQGRAADSADRVSTVVRSVSVDLVQMAKSYGVAADEAEAWAQAYSRASEPGMITSQKLAAQRQAADSYVYTLRSMRAAIEDLESGSLSLDRATEMLDGRFSQLEEHDLRQLRSAISDARREMDGLNESAERTLRQLREEMAEAEGDYEQAERIRAQQRVLELEQQIAQAKAAGATDAVQQLNEALRLQQQLNAEALKEARTRSREERSQAGTSTRSSRTTTSTGGGGSGAAPVVNIEGVLDVNDRATLDGLARKLRPVFDDLQRRGTA